VDAAHRPIQATWWWHAAERTAIIESARVIGLAMLPAGRFHPFELDSFGLGLLLKQVSACKPARWIIGLGGSATNDAGFGLARGLGWRFLDRQGQAIEQWTQLTGLHRLVGRSTTLHARGNAAVAVDVQNPLLGRKGATRVYGPQKGIRPEDVKPAEAAHARLVEVARRQYGVEGHLAGRRGAGAAGGLGFGLELFFAAAMEPGFDLFAQSVGLASRVATANVVLTGEGAIDETTLSMGKGVGGVGRLCRRLRRPCLALGGVVADAGRAARKFTLVRALAPDLTSPADARENAARWLTELAARVAADWQP
jgi:glycerate kinase